MSSSVQAHTVVAVIDTGIDESHPALKSCLWTNPGESGTDSRGRDKSSNGVDDDDNGFVDDLHGWNFVSHNNNLNDNHGHGTHIAGIIASSPSHDCNGSELMILKYYDPKIQPTDNLRNSLRALLYAMQMKAQLINYSGGGTERSPKEELLIRLAGELEIPVIAAAGNESENTDLHPYYPANYGTANIISVTAVSAENNLLPFSNWGQHSVALAAPGLNIYSTMPGGSYGLMSGTSQATAIVTHMAAQILDHHPELHHNGQLLKALLAVARHESTLKGKTKYASKIEEQNSWNSVVANNP